MNLEDSGNDCSLTSFFWDYFCLVNAVNRVVDETCRQLSSVLVIVLSRSGSTKVSKGQESWGTPDEKCSFQPFANASRNISDLESGAYT